MYTILENTNSFLALRFTKELTQKDYDAFLPVIEQKIRDQGKINFYWEMEDFEGWKLSAAWEEVKFDLRHAHDFNRVAIVGDKRWQNLMTQLMKPFTDATVRFFDPGEKEQAWEWAKN
jgi:hypothetical protein